MLALTPRHVVAVHPVMPHVPALHPHVSDKAFRGRQRAGR
jgi:hypothetical protein